MKKEIQKKHLLIAMPDKTAVSEKTFHFFSKRYAEWEDSSFEIYNYFASPTKIFFDIGAWNGCTAIYAAKIYKKIISVEPDPESIDDFKAVIEVNDKKGNIKLFKEPISNKVGEVHFAPREDKWNTSSSMIKEGDDFGQKMMATTLSDLGERAGVNLVQDADAVGLIKIDIEGGEESLLEDPILTQTMAPIFISFHLEWWKSPQRIFEMQDFFSQHKHCYVTTSFADEKESISKIPANEVAQFLFVNRFASVLLSNDEFTPGKNLEKII